MNQSDCSTSCWELLGVVWLNVTAQDRLSTARLVHGFEPNAVALRSYFFVWGKTHMWSK